MTTPTVSCLLISSILWFVPSKFVRNIPRCQTRGATQSIIRAGQTFVPFSRVRPDSRHGYQMFPPSLHQPARLLALSYLTSTTHPLNYKFFLSDKKNQSKYYFIHISSWNPPTEKEEEEVYFVPQFLVLQSEDSSRYKRLCLMWRTVACRTDIYKHGRAFLVQHSFIKHLAWEDSTLPSVLVGRGNRDYKILRKSKFLFNVLQPHYSMLSVI